MCMLQCDFVCIALLLPFVLGLCLSVFVFFSLKNFFLNNYFLFFYFNNFILFYFIFFFLSFLLSFPPCILSCVDDRLLVLQPSIRVVPLRWESQVQDTDPQETSQLHIISNGKNLLEISISRPRPSSTQRPATYSAGHHTPNN